MKNYEKPMILNMGTYEGIYAASGDVVEENPQPTPNSPQCNSIYIQGNFKQSDWSQYGTGTNIEGRRCEGCPASWGDRCGLPPTGNVNYQGDFRPSWEKEGKGPNDLWNQ